ncbi:DISARM system phospholipase D-like protein DrmC [Micromonospora sp. RL09-050-HVF-A]|uniref:DISARM system phospholipase D-like protein DrmC n=1 Tax=Micromonospora sp. RL09-050-HVF-A TaxID=1703433 RepID=UPI001C606C55|nr:DISARM system phospholipase D-like protein DrmC [Micromonospora sp. RL09-050-HVF-A]MBW4705179.1 DISARM system phospholipase D-like protein DrmC [Micromonospora sp. RL09-050-HVF-A]
MSTDPYTALGAFLTAYEAQRLATVLQAGGTTSQALKEVHAARRSEAKRLLLAAELGPEHRDDSVAILRAIAGARSVRTAISPVWTMPGVEATTGHLTSEAQRIIDDARMSIVCSSFNFTPHSGMWTALRNAAVRPGLSVTVYLDARAGSPAAVAAHLPKATVLRTLTPPRGHRPLVSHAKFIIVDRAITLLTSANFSYSAENTNIELGLLVHDTNLAASIEALMRSKHGVLYEQVT